ncbi:GTPase HflX [Paenalkalicoccus suaedae]|uniref:GTPase HflX n=1 Tax=Paenalkalicoccus suaedae TaxID=2592382 RepID=A0A859FKC8_9BACI|nr:GTPase HflX [Paenalkalicoccus suaedae]QKS73243.1 GTPase HflX [Paenalkalicoccus suaedae]
MDNVTERTHERVILVGVMRQQVTEEDFAYRVEELKALTKTAGGEVVLTVTQALNQPKTATYIGKGKLEELSLAIEETDASLVIFNDELSPSQLRNISNALDVAVLDRTQLILDIFAQRAKSREGILQVELAQLSYTLPRLRGQGVSLSRLGGGIGTRGPGETKLETDQRHIRSRMTEIKRQLEQVAKHRVQYRERRKKNQAFQVAIVGYTNAGKSTLLNRLTDANTLEEDQLFATLDPTTKQIALPSGFSVLLTDTVGFIQQLPTTLIAAFRSTLEEVTEADFLVHVIDGSNDDADNHERSVLKLINELGASEIPMLTIFNKQDKMKPSIVGANKQAFYMSAVDPADRHRFLERLEKEVSSMFSPYFTRVHAKDGHILHRFKTETILKSQKFYEEKEVYELSGFVAKDSSIYFEYLQEKSDQPERW